MANSKINDSAHLADEVQMGTYKRVSSRYPAARNNGVKQGPFYVLVGATMPSILVETAFLSNEAEEKNLNDPEYQEATVEGIVDGVRSYAQGMK
jgi:N-acetylmuramoyl-L-alanine amidase